MRLNKVQESFKDLMLDHPKALDSPLAEFAALFAQGDIPLPARLKVYRNNIVGSLTDLMLATFPTIEKLVGKEFFEGMACSFILKHPPAQGCLSLYGAGFAEFMEGFGPAKSLPYLPDMARLEIAMNEAYYAPDDAPLSPEFLAALAPEELAALRLKLRSSARLLASPFPLTAIRAFCENDDPKATLDIDSGGEMLMVYRPHLQSLIVTLAPDDFAMLASLAENLTLGEALERTLSNHPDFNLQKFLATHLGYETFSSLSTNKDREGIR